MTIPDSVSISQEGTFEEQVWMTEYIMNLKAQPENQTQELVNYIVRNKSDEDRAAFIRPFQDALKTAEGEKSIEEDEDRKKKIVSMVLENVQSLGEGSDRGITELLLFKMCTIYI
jgi:translation initiation factor 3 subunit M